MVSIKLVLDHAFNFDLVNKKETFRSSDTASGTKMAAHDVYCFHRFTKVHCCLLTQVVMAENSINQP